MKFTPARSADDLRRKLANARTPRQRRRACHQLRRKLRTNAS